MASASIKRVVGEAIASYIATRIPALSNISAVQSGPEEEFATPSVRLISETLTFEPETLQEVYWREDIDDGKLVQDCGQFSGLVTLQLWTNSKPAREQYEQAIIDLFLGSDEFSPGTIYIDSPTLTINSYVSLYSTQIRVRLDKEQWREELSFEAHRYSFLNLEVDFPALTTTNAATITDLELWLETDLTVE